MRTIQLQEYRTTVERLTRTEVEQLLASGVVSLSPAYGEGAYEIQARQHVGTVVLPSLRLLIRSKVDIGNVFFMLGYGVGLTRWGSDQFPYAQEPDLLHAVGWAFEAEVRRTLGYGLTRGYRNHEEALNTVRGRIDIARQIRSQLGRAVPLECRFDEYTDDILLNRLLKAAHRTLLRLPQLDQELRRSLHYHLRAFGTVSSEHYSAGAVPDLMFNRLNQPWETAGRLAQLILAQHTLRDAQGHVRGTTFTVDMNKLFERFIETVAREEAQQVGFTVKGQAVRNFTSEVVIRPDLIVRSADRDIAVGDVKYKQLEAGWIEADLYQMFAYTLSLGLRKGLLIYAGNSPLKQHRVERAGIVLEVIGMDIRGTPNDLLTGARSAAAQLIRQGREQLHARHSADQVAPV
jgi:5-methylcytosine-specific restriction enzyme subunit McrC